MGWRFVGFYILRCIFSQMFWFNQICPKWVFPVISVWESLTDTIKFLHKKTLSTKNEKDTQTKYNLYNPSEIFKSNSCHLLEIFICIYFLSSMTSKINSNPLLLKLKSSDHMKRIKWFRPRYDIRCPCSLARRLWQHHYSFNHSCNKCGYLWHVHWESLCKIFLPSALFHDGCPNVYEQSEMTHLMMALQTAENVTIWNKLLKVFFVRFFFFYLWFQFGDNLPEILHKNPSDKIRTIKCHTHLPHHMNLFLSLFFSFSPVKM